jgi:hypothetical protein
MTPPTLLLIFNRPDLTEQVMEQVRQAEPSQLFVAADGPRADYPKDPERCKKAREVATEIDWDCEVYTLFREENLGCKQAVSSAITWFFEHVEAGIILEDDCVPRPTFFPYCAELLERYRDDERIMAVSGDNFQPEDRTYEASYYFSAYPHCWGWATWDRAWKHYDGQISAWKSLRDTNWLEGWLGTEGEAEYWRNIFDRVAREEVDSWAYPWTFACWKAHGLTTLPAINLVTNIGFGDRATHTKTGESETPQFSNDALSFPLRHPSVVVRDYRADQFTSENHYGISDSQPPRWRQLASVIVPNSVKKVVRPVLDGNTR